MGLNCLLLAQTTGYVFSFLLSFFIYIPISVMLSEANGNCVLYAEPFNETFSGGDAIRYHWGSISNCNWVVFMGLLLSLTSAGFVAYISCLLYKDMDSSFLIAFCSAFVTCLIWFLVLITASILSTGLRVWCDHLDKHAFSCEMAGSAIPAIGANLADAYLLVSIAAACAWLVWITWLVLSVLALFKLFRFHRAERITVSLSRERERLIQRVAPVVL